MNRIWYTNTPVVAKGFTNIPCTRLWAETVMKKIGYLGAFITWNCVTTVNNIHINIWKKCAGSFHWKEVCQMYVLYLLHIFVYLYLFLYSCPTMPVRSNSYTWLRPNLLLGHDHHGYHEQMWLITRGYNIHLTQIIPLEVKVLSTYVDTVSAYTMCEINPYILNSPGMITNEIQNMSHAIYTST